MKGDREECLDAGFDEYLAKPLRAQQLHELIERSLGLFPPSEPAAIRRRSTRRSSSTWSAATRSCSATWSPCFLDGVPGMLERIRKAIDDQDARKLNDAAHELRGAVGPLRRGARRSRRPAGSRRWVATTP